MKDGWIRAMFEPLSFCSPKTWSTKREAEHDLFLLVVKRPDLIGWVCVRRYVGRWR